MPKLKIIFISGMGRSGTTLLDRIIGSAEGVSSFNELRSFPGLGLKKNYSCACGELFSECAFWSKICQQLFISPLDADRFYYLHKQVNRIRFYPKLYTGIYGNIFYDKIKEYRDWLKKLYILIQYLRQSTKSRAQLYFCQIYCQIGASYISKHCQGNCLIIDQNN